MIDKFTDKNRRLSSNTIYYNKIFSLDIIIRIQYLLSKKGHSQSVFFISTLSSAILLLSLAGLLFSLAFAQQAPGTQNEEEVLETPGNISSNIDTKDTALNATGTDLPVLEQLSDNGNYLVQVRWGQDPTLLAASGFDMEIVFLNASESEATPQTFPQKETNLTGSSTLGSSFFTDPAIIERMVPIESYDITIYSDNGEQLWKKAGQPVQAGRAYERVTFEDPYQGGITVLIDNIKSAGSMGETIGAPLSGSNENKTGDGKLATDSVKFTARVAEEKS
jgi:hypothetical protein